MSVAGAPAPGVLRMPATVLHDIRQARHGGDVYWLDIRITAEAAGNAAPWRCPIPADLGQRIADMIREACEADEGAP